MIYARVLLLAIIKFENVLASVVEPYPDPQLEIVDPDLDPDPELGMNLYRNNILLRNF
jgi:hypothetical protein